MSRRFSNRTKLYAFLFLPFLLGVFSPSIFASPRSSTSAASVFSSIGTLTSTPSPPAPPPLPSCFLFLASDNIFILATNHSRNLSLINIPSLSNHLENRASISWPSISPLLGNSGTIGFTCRITLAELGLVLTRSRYTGSYFPGVLLARLNSPPPPEPLPCKSYSPTHTFPRSAPQIQTVSAALTMK